MGRRERGWPGTRETERESSREGGGEACRGAAGGEERPGNRRTRQRAQPGQHLEEDTSRVPPKLSLTPGGIAILPHGGGYTHRPGSPLSFPPWHPGCQTGRQHASSICLPSHPSASQGLRG